MASACDANSVPFSLSVDDFADCIEPSEMGAFTEALTTNAEIKRRRL